MNDYPMYSMWWIIIVGDYFEKTNARDFAKKQIPYPQGLLKQIDACVKENGELEYLAYFVDWATSGQPDEMHGIWAINVIAVKKAIMLLKQFNKNTALAKNILECLLK